MNSTPGKKPEAAKPEPPKKAAFEQSLARLEEIVRKLESANLPLDDAMRLLTLPCSQTKSTCESGVGV